MIPEQQMLSHTGCTLSELADAAIALLREHEPPEGYYGCFSGGKDSVVIKELARIAGVRVDWNYNVTTADPPELTRFIKEHHPDVAWNRSKNATGSIFKEMVKRGHPTRRFRWCCAIYKEDHGNNRRKIIGIRADESPRRAKQWNEVSTNRRTKQLIVLPIYRWLTCDVWQFIRSHNLPYCSLYDEGFDRIGCILCPMASARIKQLELQRWPKIAALWRRGFQQLWDSKPDDWTIKRRFNSCDEHWQWWIGDDSYLPEQCGEPDLKDFLF
jgi:phosphoadenosine phosphosulfate reductase